jgi:ribonuclease HI
MPSPGFKCVSCGGTFTLQDKVLKLYPNWTPKLCLACRGSQNKPRKPELNLPTAEVLERFTGGPDTGVFTDGSCERNPGGPGGWGVVKVFQGKPVAERNGHAEMTTSNQMELTALIEAFKMLASDEEIDVYTDSKYCHSIATKWAANWKRLGWKRNKKGEEVKNLDLVKELHELVGRHPKAAVQWIPGHEGCRWNEYADSLSTAYTRTVR